MALVSIVRCEEYSLARRAVVEALKPLGGIEKFVGPGMKVALKVNLVISRHPDAAATTHPAVVEAVGDLCVACGAQVCIVDGPGNLFQKEILKGIYRGTGMLKLADKEGFSVNFDTAAVELDNPRGLMLKKITAIKALTEADVVINMPKLKTHCQMMYSGAVKNMFGAVPGLLKMEYHFRMPDYRRFADALIDIFLAAKPNLTVMDAVVGMDGDGPTFGRPKKIGLILASEDAFAMDWAGVRIFGIEPMKVPVIQQAVERGLMPGAEEEIVFPGLSLQECLLEDVKVPSAGQTMDIHWLGGPFGKFLKKLMEPKIVFKEHCTGCGHCRRVCHAQAISMVEKRPVVEHGKCIRCFCCHELCPSAAVEIRRPWYFGFLLPRARKRSGPVGEEKP